MLSNAQLYTQTVSHYYFEMQKIIILRGQTGSGKSTAIVGLIANNDLNLVEIEIDVIKEFFKSEISDPKTVLTIAGLVTRDIFQHKKTSVVIEGAFDEKIKLDTFMDALGKDTNDMDVVVIKLTCNEDTSIRRKYGILTERTVIGQCKKDMFDITGEIKIDTDKYDKQETLELIISELNKNGG